MSLQTIIDYHAPFDGALVFAELTFGSIPALLLHHKAFTGLVGPHKLLSHIKGEVKSVR